MVSFSLLTTTGILSCLLWSPLAVHSASYGQCSNNASYNCPSLSDLCGEPVFVKDCLDCKGYLSTDTKDDVCFDRKLLSAKDNPNPSYLWRDILGMIVWFLTSGIAAACGVGGGGVYVPLGILLLNFAPKPSSGLSQASILGAMLGGLLLNLRNHHPSVTKVSNVDGGRVESLPSCPEGHITTNTTEEKEEEEEEEQYFTRPLVDFDMALFLAPIQMGGAVLGVLVQKILPDWLYLTLASIILGYTAHKTYQKFVTAHAKEVAAARRTTPQQDDAEPQQEASHQDTEAPVTKEAIPEQATMVDVSSSAPDEKHPKNASSQVPSPVAYQQESTATDDEESAGEVSDNKKTPQEQALEAQEKAERRMYWLKQDSRQYPSEKIFGLAMLWTGLILLTFLQGGKGVDSIVGITCASPWYAVLIVAQLVWTIGIGTIYAFRLRKQTKDKIACDYPYHPQDVIWDFQKLRFYGCCTFLAGAVAGLIGVGGGMILNPLMIIMGIHPMVSSATNGIMVVMTSSIVAIMFVTAGLVPWPYVVTFFFVCLIGSLFGKTVIDSYIKKSGKSSILILLLAGIILFATIGCLVIVLTRLAAADWCFAGMNEFCSASTGSGDDEHCPVDRLLFGEPYKH
jgi:uncharacterized membrane protein YfcA